MTGQTVASGPGTTDDKETIVNLLHIISKIREATGTEKVGLDELAEAVENKFKAANGCLPSLKQTSDYLHQNGWSLHGDYMCDSILYRKGIYAITLPLNCRIVNCPESIAKAIQEIALAEEISEKEVVFNILSHKENQHEAH